MDSAWGGRTIRWLVLAGIAGSLVGCGEARSSQTTETQTITVSEIVDRYIEARGGRDALQRIHMLQWRMPPREDGRPVPVMTKKRPFYFVIGELEGERDYAEGNDGTPWEYYANPGLVIRTTDAPAAATRHTAYFDDGLIMSQTPGWDAELQGREQIGDREAYRILVTYPDGYETLTFVDVETFLIIAARATAPVHAFGDPVTSQTRIGGYVDVSGVLYPTVYEEVEIATGRLLNRGTPWASITANLDFPDEVFAPPPAPDTPLARMLNAAYAARAIPSNSLGWYRAFRENPATAGIDTQYGIEVVGYQCLKNGAIETGIVLLEANLDEHPDSPSALFGLGRAYRTADREDEAVRLFERALEIDPEYQRALDALGR